MKRSSVVCSRADFRCIIFFARRNGLGKGFQCAGMECLDDELYTLSYLYIYIRVLGKHPAWLWHSLSLPPHRFAALCALMRGPDHRPCEIRPRPCFSVCEANAAEQRKRSECSGAAEGTVANTVLLLRDRVWLDRCSTLRYFVLLHCNVYI